MSVRECHQKALGLWATEIRAAEVRYREAEQEARRRWDRRSRALRAALSDGYPWAQIACALHMRQEDAERSAGDYRPA